MKMAIGLSCLLPASVVISLLFVLYFAMYSTTSYHRPLQHIKLSAVRTFGRQRLFQCNDIHPVSFLGQRGPFWVLYNYVTPTYNFACDESVTYTTHADYTYLDNLVPLLERWQGPVSLSLYAPGTDFYETLLRIHYLRKCSPLVRDFVSFHLFFDGKQIPQNLSLNAETAFGKLPKVNCSVRPNFGQNVTTFKTSRKLTYPVNVGRNVAREMAPTYYVLASDIELYPSPNLIPNFLEMIRRSDDKFNLKPKVFVLPIFEVNVRTLPYDKIELQQLLNKTVAFPFHKNVCRSCHAIPNETEWMRAKVLTKDLNVFHVAKRHGDYYHWEPIYIGTKFDPMYDERLSWEGRKDKMTQAYILCVLDYEFHILDNAFLVHRPGIKRPAGDVSKNKEFVRLQNEMIKKIIMVEITQLYGLRPHCSV